MSSPPSLPPAGDTSSPTRAAGNLTSTKVGRDSVEPSQDPRSKSSQGSTESRPTSFEIRVHASPLDMLLPYQRAWKEDDARFKIGLMARQVGKDFSMGGEGVASIFEQEIQKQKHAGWLLGAPSERQSIESLEKWKEWTEAFQLSIADLIEEREDPRNSESLLKSSTIVFPNGSRVIAVPGKPGTVRGFSMNVALTEFAFFEQPDETLRAVLPSITNPLRGGVKRIRLISTPNGAGTKFHELVTKAVPRFKVQVPSSKQPGTWNLKLETDAWRSAIASGQKGLWSLHKVTIHDAVAQGLPVDIEELRAALNDPEGWAQEYECEFMDTAGVLLPYELIAPCENPLATRTVDPALWSAAQTSGRYICGVDFGRKKDLTVCWTLEELGGAYLMTKEVLELRGMSTPDQLEILRPRFRRAHRVCLDYTGPGIGLGDLAVAPKEGFGEWNPAKHQYGKVELCTFTNALKLEIFPALRVAFEQKRIGIPVSREIREDLHSVYRVVTKAGNSTYTAPHSADGHADRCTALALAVRGAAFTGVGFTAEVI